MHYLFASGPSSWAIWATFYGIMVGVIAVDWIHFHLATRRRDRRQLDERLSHLTAWRTDQ